MRLKSIKLAGFKSFVEATRIEVTAEMTAIVGPNGCGKSNVIDAVRWVLGESSAKHLRGENMTDVIFNGSLERAAFGRASVELIFDNRDKRVQGEFGRFDELQVRREVLRDGSNHFHINGQKCRRKDIAELFMGTGLGPRSYAIIEQGTISRLIESRPAELKLFLEEAAGVSRYKERRKETENRIAQTQANLARLGDIQAELDERLSHLQGQAQSAAHYSELKRCSRQMRSDLMQAELLALDQRGAQLAQQLAEQGEQLAARDTQQQTADTSFLQLSQQRQSLGASVTARQSALLAGAQQLTRLEEQERHQADLSQRFAAEQAQLTEALSQQQTRTDELQAQVTAQQSQVASAQQAALAADSALQQAQTTKEAASAALAQSHAAQQQWQTEHTAEQLALQQSQHQVAALAELARKTQLARWSAEEELAAVQRGLSQPLRQACQESEQALTACAAAHETAQQQMQREHASQRRAQQRLFAAEQTAATLGAQLGTLDKLFGSNLAGESLASTLRGDPHWAPALDKVLGQWWSASACDALAAQSCGRWLSECAPACAGTLAATLDGHFFPAFLNSIFTAPDAVSARARQASLAAGESVITPQGDWFGANWVDLGEYGAVSGRELWQLRQQVAGELATANAQVATCARAVAEGEQQLQATLLAQNLSQQALDAARVTRQDAHGAWQHHLGQQLAQDEQSQRLQAQIDALVGEQQQEQRRAEVAQQTEQAYASVLARSVVAGERAAAAQAQAQAWVGQCEQRLESARLAREQALARAQAAAQREESQQMLLAREQQALARQQLSLSELTAPAASPAQQLAPLQKEQAALERQHSAELEALASVEAQLAALEKSRGDGQKLRVRVQERYAQLQLEQARVQARVQALHEQAQQQGVTWPAETGGVSGLDEAQQGRLRALDSHAVRQEIAALERRVSELGPINLAALAEYDEAKARADYLLAQKADLEQAIATLQQAVNRIDKESAERFSETFARVNADLADLFPTVFGGGSAWLELTRPDVREAGVQIMARPPGKKNATIALLSGGEKALTALALVFAIFRLTPAPFCLLDEVDAPLDEVNVGRFCALVKAMSRTVQFIYISHNKVSMAMAQQLIGVTMQEPGVSRIVSVDIGAAVAMLENS
ncbi:MAG: AAA family ATPase [Aeromonas sp.]